MTPELKLAVTAAGLLLLLAGSIAWVVYDCVKRRQKRRRWEMREERLRARLEWDRLQAEEWTIWMRYLWVDILNAHENTLMNRGERLGQVRKRLESMRFQLLEMKEDRDACQKWEALWHKHHGPVERNGRTERTKLDGYYYYQED